MLVEVTVGDSVEHVEVPDNEVISFPQGVFGFEEVRGFVLFELDAPFCLLQSVDNPHVGFVVMDPFVAEPSFKIASVEAQGLTFAEEDSRCVFAIVTLTEGGPNTVNLRAPIIVNPTRKEGMQVILRHEWPVRHPFTPRQTAAPSADGAAQSHAGGLPC